MHYRYTLIGWLALALISVAMGQEKAPAEIPVPLDMEVPEGLEVLTRGPVHEAFAEQTSPTPSEGIVTEAAPPEPINEVPPEMRPDGSDIVWIPGYWFWDDERSDYMWVSGVWRRPPPGRRWMPGYWQPAEDGHQWVAGFWGPSAVKEVEYLDLPPESLESGPSSPAPSSSHFWMPGSWSWTTSSYRWQPGSWCRHRDDWIWVAARYVWTPRGCVFVSGYWDHSLTHRGHLFAPIFFRSPIYRHAGFSYRPVCWIGYEPLLLHLFVRPHCHHLYFGDYYAPLYRQRSFMPCYTYHARHRGFASLYVYYQHHYHQHGIDYCGRVRDWHGFYAQHAHQRPARTFQAQLRHPRRGVGQLQHHDSLARPYATASNSKIAGHRLVPVTGTTRMLTEFHTRRLRELGRSRKNFEVAARSGTDAEQSAGGLSAKVRQRFALPPTGRTDAVANTSRSGKRIPTDVLRVNRGKPSPRVGDGGQNAEQTANNSTRNPKRDSKRDPARNSTRNSTRSALSSRDTGAGTTRANGEGANSATSANSKSGQPRSLLTPGWSSRLQSATSDGVKRRQSATPSSATQPSVTPPFRSRTSPPQSTGKPANSPVIRWPSGSSLSPSQDATTAPRAKGNSSSSRRPEPSAESSARRSAKEMRGTRSGLGSNAERPADRTAPPARSFSTPRSQANLGQTRSHDPSSAAASAEAAARRAAAQIQSLRRGLGSNAERPANRTVSPTQSPSTPRSFPSRLQTRMERASSAANSTRHSSTEMMGPQRGLGSNAERPANRTAPSLRSSATARSRASSLSGGSSGSSRSSSGLGRSSSSGAMRSQSGSSSGASSGRNSSGSTRGGSTGFGSRRGGR